MGNNNSSSSSREEPKEEETDIGFEETVVEAPSPPEPRADPDIRENIDGSSTFTEHKVTSEYEEIKEAIQKRSAETGKSYVYRDADFPANSKSLYYSRNAPSQWDTLKWRRPSEISERPSLLKDGITSEDIRQGMLGDCWFLASCAAISRSTKHMRKVVPEGQVLSGADYVGAFHFRFWRFGSWVDVIVDDYLPTIYSTPAFGKSSNKDEFWLPLLEKAYAKLHNSYQAIEGGFTQDGMEDLTGGIVVTYDLRDKTPANLLTIIRRALRRASFVCVALEGSRESVNEQTGLVSAHAYAVLQYAKIPYRGGQTEILKLRNPWGNDVEWKGDWSDDSSNWHYVSDDIKRDLYAHRNNGEWWMSYDDLVRNFSDITFCTVGPDFDNDGAPSGDKWLLSTIKGEWALGASTGGSRNDLDSYVTNPQYLLELKEPDDFNPGEDDPSEKGKCSIIAGLMQEYRRVGRSTGMENLYLALNIFKVRERPTRKLDVRYFSRNREVLSSGTYINRREVTISSLLSPGLYVIVPSTFYTDKSGSFLVRIFTEKAIDLYELK